MCFTSPVGDALSQAVLRCSCESSEKAGRSNLFLKFSSLHIRTTLLYRLAGPAAFRPRVNATSVYSSLVENGRPVLQGLLAVDIIAKEVMP